MNGFLSNTWRDTLAVVGVALAILQCLALFYEWRSRGKGKRPWFRLGILEAYRESQHEEIWTPRERRLLWLAFVVSLLLMAGGSALLRYEIAGGISLFFMSLIALVQEAALPAAVFSLVPGLLDRENEWFLAPALGTLFVGLLGVAYWVLHLCKTEPYTSWWCGAVETYAAIYFFVFILLCIEEVSQDVTRWREEHKPTRSAQ